MKETDHGNAKVRVRETQQKKRKATILTFKTTEEAERLVNPAVQNVWHFNKRNGIVMDKEMIRNLLRNFVRLERGCKTDIRTPVWKRMSRSAVLALWLKVYERGVATLKKNVVPSYVEGFEEVEDGQRDNCGPQSMFKPFSDDGPEKVQAVMSDKKLDFRVINRQAYLRALDDVRTLLPHGSVSEITIDQAINGLKGDGDEMDGNTNSGNPFFAGHWKPSEKHNDDRTKAIYDYYKGRATQIVQLSKTAASWKDIPLSFAGVTFQRTVSKGKDPWKSKKVKRLVIGMPKEEAIAGKTVAAPIQINLTDKAYNKAEHIPIFPAWRSKPVLDKCMQIMLEHAEKNGRAVLSGDISSFDATLPPQVMLDVAEAMTEWLTPSAGRLLMAIIHADVENFTLFTPTGLASAERSSVKSGSIFTSIIGCLCNYFIQRYGHHAGYYTIEQQAIMGDDFCVDGPGITPQSMSRAFADFGMDCNPTKQFWRRGMLHFLQMLHVLGAPGGQGSVYRILNNVMNRENEERHYANVMTPLAYVYQALARLENASFNPLFEDLVMFVAKGDKYQLGKNLSLEVLKRGGGEYVLQSERDARYKPWKASGSGVPFEHWAVNRVLRGERLPPPSKQRWETIYGISYDALAV